MQPFEPGKYYHIYNRANGFEKLFLSDENYRYFLRQYVKYIEPVAITYAWCLLPNHFHFLIKIRNPDLVGADEGFVGADLEGFQNLQGRAGGNKVGQGETFKAGYPGNSAIYSTHIPKHSTKCITEKAVCLCEV